MLRALSLRLSRSHTSPGIPSLCRQPQGTGSRTPSSGQRELISPDTVSTRSHEGLAL